MRDRPSHLITSWGRPHGVPADGRPSPRPRPTPGPATGPWPGVPTAEIRVPGEDSDSTETITLPPRIVPGPLGVDSPVAEASLSPYRWHAWLDLAASRAAGRPTTRRTLESALGRHLESMWGLAWLTVHRALGRQLLHQARVYSHDGGETLVSACLLTSAWVGPSENVAPMASIPPDLGIARCTVCAEVAGVCR